ncbi:PIR Superfamily Protein [Plasmodium ovale wallikeri]|uniref:PIR Superfamily Protein n=1 Tax=Plasmodium ovale wallikeri TaxID=864142 RepID=A0A1A9AM99_PLAOA|nr:PIR Superfamily Protein [Plasmodium ovale wallikeri]SBT57757.1 PIR Superfamily Protein [Plasmodium ovale wallikeri]
MKNITINDLPSGKYYDKLKSSIDYDTLEHYTKHYPGIESINTWLSDFKTNIANYFKDPSVRQSIISDKRCRDLNYLMCDIVQKILSFNKNVPETILWANDLKTYSKRHFSDNPDFKCDIPFTYSRYSSDMKLLDDYCEDSTFINQQIHDIQCSDKCKNIYHYMSIQNNKLKQISRILPRKRISKITDTCTIDNIESLLSPQNCKPCAQASSSFNTSPRINRNTPSVETLSKTLQDEPPITPGFQSSEEKKSPLTSEENEINNYSTWNVISSISFPTLGILLFSFFLYKFTPLGPKLQVYLRRKNNTPIKKYDESTNELLDNMSNSTDVYSGDMQCNIPYHTLEN